MKTNNENVTKGLSFWIWIFVFISCAITESSQNSSLEDKMTHLSQICRDLLKYCRILEKFLKPLAHMKRMETEVRNLSSALDHQGSKISEWEQKHDTLTLPGWMHWRHNDQLVSVYSRMDQLNQHWVFAERILANLKQKWEDLGRQLTAEANHSSIQTSERELQNRFREVRESFEQLKEEQREIQSKWQTAKRRMENLIDKLGSADTCHSALESQLNTLKDSVPHLREGGTGETIALSETPPSCHSLGIV